MLTATTLSQAGKAKQIAVATTTASEAMYTVPAGRTFRGVYVGDNASSGIVINGAEVKYGIAVVPITLLAGTVVTNRSAAVFVSLTGVEE
jgi:hypothetical protein